MPAISRSLRAEHGQTIRRHRSNRVREMRSADLQLSRQFRRRACDHVSYAVSRFLRHHPLEHSRSGFLRSRLRRSVSQLRRDDDRSSRGCANSLAVRNPGRSRLQSGRSRARRSPVPAEGVVRIDLRGLCRFLPVFDRVGLFHGRLRFRRRSLCSRNCPMPLPDSVRPSCRTRAGWTGSWRNQTTINASTISARTAGVFCT